MYHGSGCRRRPQICIGLSFNTPSRSAETSRASVGKATEATGLRLSSIESSAPGGGGVAGARHLRSWHVCFTQRRQRAELALEQGQACQ
ncbi:unnamed protein product [Closterium sp. NIES-53]